MHTAKYIDEKGDTILSFSSSIPGVMVVPPGKKLEDAIHISEDEFHRERKAKEAKNPKPRDIAAELDELRQENLKLKADLEALKTNVDKPKRS